MFIKGDIVKTNPFPSLKTVEKIEGDIITLRYVDNPSDEFVHCTRVSNVELVERSWSDVEANYIVPSMGC